MFLLLSTSVFADSNENCYTSSDVERKGGLYYLAGDDAPFTGTSKCIWAGGQILQSLVEMKAGKRDGVVIKWYQNGDRWLEKNYKDGRQDGKSFVWWDTHGDQRQIRSEGNYKNGQREGKHTEWYRNGQKKSEENWKNGLLEHWSEWHENGELKSEIRYKAVEIPWGEVLSGFWPFFVLLLFALWAFFPSKENKEVEKLLRGAMEKSKKE